MFGSRFASKLLPLALLSLSKSLYAQPAPPVTLNIQADKPIAKVSPTLYGLMTEEINYSYDGGLYAELVNGRAPGPQWDALEHWVAVTEGSAQASISVDPANGPSTALPRCLKVTIKQAGPGEQAGVLNDGYWGIPVRPDTTYQASFYAKTDAPSLGPVKISIVDNQSGRAVASATIPSITSEWKQYSTVLKTGQVSVSATNHLVLSVEHPGTLWLDLVSLFPPTYKDREHGFRIDLMEKLAGMHPAFLRFPGGNYLEGDHIAERFDWKKTIGPWVDRPTHPSPWHYHSSDGMGLLEFLYWCEDLHMQPVLAVYAGYSMMQEHVEPGAALDPYVQDALDEIEYVTGGSDTRWGAIRAKNGHPAPFSLTYVEVGNEDFFDKSGSYDGRYAQFYKAIKQKYPQLQLIATTPVSSIKPDVVDDHYYKKAEEFFADVHHYDGTDRNGPKIFVGEWATREGGPTPNFGAALGDAAWMTGMERNSDIVVMASYAPLLVNVNPGGMQWRTDLIGYDTLTSYGSPSYYAQVMFANHLGKEVVGSTVSGGGPRFFYSATKDEDKGILYLKLVNASSVPQPVDLRLMGAGTIGSTAKLISLSSKTTQDTNTLADPMHIVPTETALTGVKDSFSHTVPPYAIQILEVSLK
ncbi:Alpha-N-arabinofuranosidase [Acidisarcina polymorpha]|uniref:non-reducing end alpha-L-arabinofuranosidase n=1 Tax=Acidisarcina polymorpha TaxID=2211140 RepID=A0A2Z5G2P0_9BACT|nr:alpha-L-arabinofuranosidase C-terminal domain-containing protein [Acidisarcina polymorpha]AXC13382.1 Alpha-N-arabinofuranosidase [Acidisarcina polymorpha]